MATEVLLVDDHRLARVGIASSFTGTEFVVTGEAELAEHALELVAARPFQLVIMESRLGGHDALGCLQKIKLDHPETPVLVYSAYDNPVQVSQSNILGAAGYLTKEQPLSVLLDACRKAVEGESLWTTEMLRRVNVSIASLQLGKEQEVQLTSREIQVLTHMSDGATNKEIAAQLEISYETVKEHVQNVLRKIGVSDRTQAAVWAVRNRII